MLQWLFTKQATPSSVRLKHELGDRLLQAVDTLPLWTMSYPKHWSLKLGPQWVLI